MRGRVATGALVAALAVAGAASAAAQPAVGVVIEYIAHACFRITSPDGQRLVVDPYASRVWIGYDFPPDLAADAVLISHPHYDHDAGTSRGHEFPWTDAVPVWRDPGVYELGDITVTGVTGKHADPYGKEFGQTNTIWRIDVGGLSIVHIGDNGPIGEAAAARLGEPDVLMLPLDADDHILSEQEGAAIRARLTPRILVPMHYRLPELEPVAGEPDDLGDIDGWLARHAGDEQLRLGSNRYVLSPDGLPARPLVLVFAPSPLVPRGDLEQ